MVIRVERDEKDVIKTEWPRYCDNWQNSHCSALSARDMRERRRLTPSPPAAPSTPAGWQLRGVTPGQGPTLHTLWSVFSWTYFIIPTRLQSTLDQQPYTQPLWTQKFYSAKSWISPPSVFEVRGKRVHSSSKNDRHFSNLRVISEFLFLASVCFYNNSIYLQ